MGSLSQEQARAVWTEMLPLRRAGYALIPLTASRTPFTGWRQMDYTTFAFIEHLIAGGAVGVRLGPEDLVIDIDPRNGGDESFRALCWDLDADLDADDVPTVRSGGGGTHLYYRKPEGRTRVTLPKLYPGIDFKRVGGYVVAPGSHHPSGRRYEWLRPLGTPPRAPERLLALLTRPPAPVGAVEPASTAGTPLLTADELETLLGVVDASMYGQGAYEDWLAMGMSCHAATAGAGFEEWADWCASDENYADVTVEALGDRWKSFAVGGGVTHRTLFKAVADAGRSDLLRGFSAVLDFDDALERQRAAPTIDNSERRRVAPIKEV